MDATELLYEARTLAARVHPDHRERAERQVERAAQELDALEDRLRRLIGLLERATTTQGER